jgi:hypothetical protein
MTTSPASTTSTTARYLAEAWIAFWNGDLERADALLTTGFRIHFGGRQQVAVAGDAVRGPEQMAAYIQDFRAQRPGLRFCLDAPPIADDLGFAMRWSAQRPDVAVGGIDILHLAGNRIAEVWSVTAGRRFPA